MSEQAPGGRRASFLSAPRSGTRYNAVCPFPALRVVPHLIFSTKSRFPKRVVGMLCPQAWGTLTVCYNRREAREDAWCSVQLRGVL